MDLKKRSTSTILSTAILCVVIVLTILGFFGNTGLICELASHFPIVYAATLGVCFLLLIRSRQWLSALLAITFCLINIGQIKQFYQENSYATPLHKELTVLQINTWAPANSDCASAVRAVRSKDATIVGFIELNKHWIKELGKSLPEYPYRFVYGCHGGLALFSKVPIEKSNVVLLKGKRPHIVAEVEVSGQKYTLILAHASLPVPFLFELRNEAFDSYAKEARESKNPVIVFGDFNCSPWSFYFQNLLKDSNLKDSEIGFGFQPTWFAPTGLPFIPIDHLLASKNLCIVERQTGPAIGSDHLPVYVRLGLP